jgi:K+-transporting ATPase ATPase A chain
MEGRSDALALHIRILEHFTTLFNRFVNSMHDSSMPISGLMELLGMMVNAFMAVAAWVCSTIFIYIIIAVFISGLMVGRTPEFMVIK